MPSCVIRAPLRTVVMSIVIAASVCCPRTSVAAPYQDPPALASENGALNVLMIAAKRPQVNLGGVTTDLWTYEICRLPAEGANACPAGTGYSGLSGTRLALQPGDTLRVRLINQLPPVSPIDADHVADQGTLGGNPTNLHTHGLIVEPHRSTGPSDPYGDYVFLEVGNPANPIPPGGGHPGVDIARHAAEYLYPLEAAHPPGLYWYHPHLHGLSLNQVSAGLAGPMTIGDASDVCGNALCRLAVNRATVRHLVLKDTQVGPGGELKTQEEPNFCSGERSTVREGSCKGQWFDHSDPETNFRGGRWLHTVSGQVYPTIGVGPEGDVWRILAASGSRSYALSLVDSATGESLPMQILSVDGVTVTVDPNASIAQLTKLFGRKVRLMPCPGQLLAGVGGAVCASTISMMPSSRVDVRVVRNDLRRTAQNAVFRTAEFTTGDNGAGDAWPAIDLAAVTLAPRGLLTPTTIPLRDLSATLLSTTGNLLAPVMLRLPGTARSGSVSAASVAAPASGPAIQDVTLAPSVAITQAQLTGKVSVANCTPLLPGHRRKILFGFPTPTTFGLGYVEMDGTGHDIEATRVPVSAFDPAKATICVPLPGGNATYEVWELQNITDEDHNFHIHQTKFFVSDGGALPGDTLLKMLNGNLVLHDNVPVPRPAAASGCDGTEGPVRSGACVPSSTIVVIPFREVGDFVFHCHILEHEDGGMMARIRVVASQ